MCPFFYKLNQFFNSRNLNIALHLLEWHGSTQSSSSCLIQVGSHDVSSRFIKILIGPQALFCVGVIRRSWNGSGSILAIRMQSGAGIRSIGRTFNGMKSARRLVPFTAWVAAASTWSSAWMRSGFVPRRLARMLALLCSLASRIGGGITVVPQSGSRGVIQSSSFLVILVIRGHVEATPQKLGVLHAFT